MKCQCGIYDLFEEFYLGGISVTKEAGRFIILPPEKIFFLEQFANDIAQWFLSSAAKQKAAVAPC
jgi:hypothetical protein